MSAERGFVTFLILTLACLGVVVVTGLKARRRVHIAAVVSAVACLGVTIFHAEQMGDHYDLAAAGAITPIHLTIAKLCTLAYLGPLITGVLTWRDARHRRLHRTLAFTVLGLTVATAITGTWMLLASERLPG
jgi:hypothetical protein